MYDSRTPSVPTHTPFGLLIWFSNISILNVPDEGYSRNMLCVNSNRNKTSLAYLVETKANILHITEVEIILSVCLFPSFTGFIFSFQKDIYNFPIL